MTSSDALPAYYQRAALLMADLSSLNERLHRSIASDPSSTSLVNNALSKAVDFLSKGFCLAGCWIDFFYVASGGRDWITAYVGWSLLQLLSPPSDLVRQAAALLIRDRYESGAWGYRPGLPMDADSTSWATLFLQASSTSVNLARAVELLLLHQNPADGGFQAYRTADDIGYYIQAEPGTDLSAWVSSHLCVTCAAVQALCATGMTTDAEPIRKALAFIRQRQTDDGYWNAYWYYGRTYGTLHALRILHDIGDESDWSRLERARIWLEEGQLADGSWNSGVKDETGRAFDTGLAISALLEYPRPPYAAIERGIAWLIEQQQPDGHWESRPTLQLPPGSQHYPWQRTDWPDRANLQELYQGVCVPDENCFYTTATALQALAAWRKSQEGILQ